MKFCTIFWHRWRYGMDNQAEWRVETHPTGAVTKTKPWYSFRTCQDCGLEQVQQPGIEELREWTSITKVMVRSSWEAREAIRTYDRWHSNKRG